MPFLTQGKTNWKYILIVVILAVIVGGIVWYCYPKLPETKPPTTTPSELKEEVTVITDKTEYETGETIKITVKNYLDKSIWYNGQPEFRCENAFFIGAKEENYKEFHSLATAYCISPAQELKSNSEQVFELKLNDEGNMPGFNQWLKITNIPFPGIYKIEFRYGPDKENSAENKVYSGEFEIKEETTKCENCKAEFISWCENCRSLGWPGGSNNSPVLSIETTMCLNECFGIIFPKTVYCNYTKQTCKDFGVSEVDETVNWKTYRNEEYGLEFQYPGKWLSLTFKSQINDNIYLFSSQNESIGSIYYYKPLKILSFIEKGGEVECVYRGQCFQKTLKIIYPSKEIKVIHSTSLDQARWYADIDSVNFSPDGKYICFILSMYEFGQPYLINIESGLNILKDHNIWFDNPYKNLYWSPNNKVLAIQSYLEEFGGQGTDGIFVSDYENPDKLNKVFSLDHREVTASPGLHISDLHFIGDDKLSFLVSLEEWNQEKGEYDVLKITKYEYIIQTKELKEIKE